MKNFPATFALMKNLKAGIAPVWVVKMTVGGVDHYISDRAFDIPPWGKITKGWVRSWGSLKEGISGAIDEFRISDLSVSCLVDPDVSPNVLDLALDSGLEVDPVSLFLWFEGCPDPPQEFFRGYVRDCRVLEGDTICDFELQDETLKWERTYIGNKVTLQDYPFADPDDVGKIEPIIFGSVSKLPALAVDAGVQTNITNAINATGTSVVVSDVRGLSVGMLIQVDAEQMLISAISGNALTVTRGANSTLAAAHQRGAVAWEQKANFYYIAAGHPVNAIPKAYAVVGQVVLDISSLCTVWPAGNHPSFPGKAVVSVPGYITIEQAVNLAIADGIVVGNGTLAAGLSGNVTKSGGAGLSGNVGYSGSVSLSGLVALVGAIADPGHTHTTGQSNSENTTTGLPTGYYPAATAVSYGSGTWGIAGFPNVVGLYLDFPADGARSQASYSITLNFFQTANGVPIYFVVNGQILYQTVLNIVAGSPWSCSFSAGSVQVDRVYIMSNMGGSAYYYVTAASRTIQLTSLISSANSAFVSKGSLAASNGTLGVGNTLQVDNGTLAVSDTIQIDRGTLDAALSGAVAKTGTVALSGNSVANTLVADQILVDVEGQISEPSEAIHWLLSTWCNVASLEQHGTLPESYAFNGAITDYRLALDVVHDLAWQCRSRFRLSMGTGILTVRENNPALVKTLPWCRVEGGKKKHSRTRSPYGEIINEISLLYDRDWTQGRSTKAFRAVSRGSAAESISTFGLQARPELFMCDMITGAAMADDVRGFYLAYYSVRHWTHVFESYFYDCELEFSDCVKLDFAGGATGQVEQVEFELGAKTINLTVVE